MNNENWPEDEAYMTWKQWEATCVDEGIEFANKWLPRQVAHMHRVFDDMIDIARYDAELNRLLGK